MVDDSWREECLANIRMLSTGIGRLKEGMEVSPNSSIVRLCENIIELSQKLIEEWRREIERENKS